MPSGAKKRKAAKKKLQKEVPVNGSHNHGNDDHKPHDNREGGGGEVERKHNEHGTKEIRLGEGTVGESGKEMRSGEKFKDVIVEDDDGFRQSLNGNASDELRSSSGSSSEDDEVEVRKEKLVEPELEAVEQCDQTSFPQVVSFNEARKPVDYVLEMASSGNPVNCEFRKNSVDEGIPVEESVKEVVSLSQDSNPVPVTESVSVDKSTFDEVESGLKQNLNEVSPLSDKQGNVSTVVTSLVPEKTEAKVIPAGDIGFGQSSEPVDPRTRDDKSLLPQYSGVTNVDRDGGNNNIKESKKHNYPEELPLVSSAPMPVQRTSWMNCCGLFEVLSGVSSR